MSLAMGIAGKLQRFAVRAACVVLAAGFVIVSAYILTPPNDSKKAEAAATLLAKEFPPAPGSEGALRQAIDGIQRDQPNYGRMSGKLADTIRQQLPTIKNRMDGLGPVEAITFVRRREDLNLYQVRFTTGSMGWSISLGEDGMIDALGVGVGLPQSPKDYIQYFSEARESLRGFKDVTTVVASFAVIVLVGRFVLRVHI